MTFFGTQMSKPDPGLVANYCVARALVPAIRINSVQHGGEDGQKER